MEDPSCFTPTLSIPCRRRQPSTHEKQSRDLKDHLSMSTNVAYGQVKIESSGPDTYEELDTLAVGRAPVYVSADETTLSTTTPTGKL